jgi:hypothetical protein
VSGNTPGARLWTDGKSVAPMMQRPPAVVKCRHCGECCWLADAQVIGEVERAGLRRRKPVNPEWENAQHVAEPSETKYYEAIEKGLAKNAEEEGERRILAWWRKNDAFRDAPPSGPGASETGPWRENLETLLPLLNEDTDGVRLM